MRHRTIVTAAVMCVGVACAIGGCQPKQADLPTTRATAAEASTHDPYEPAPPPRGPLRRVEVISRSTSELAESLVGRKCRVQIRRDALGLAGNAPAGMTGRWASEMSVDGTVLEMTDQWLVVQATGRRVVIPHASVLVIELQE